MKYLTHKEMFIYLLDESKTPDMVLNNGRLGLYNEKPLEGVLITISDVISNIITLEKEINSQLVKMKNPIHLCMNALISGNNIFLYSKPGAAKTTLASKIAEAIGRYFKLNFTPETTKNDLFGPVSIDGIKKGLWTREWSGLAKAQVALIDEFYKGSSAIRNSLLDVGEEHKLSDGASIFSIPLLLLIAASNEMVDPNEYNAMWDRFALRSELTYPNEEKDMIALFSSDSGKRPIGTRIDPEEIQLLQGYCELEAMKMPTSIITALVKVLQALLNEGISISPRRRLAWAKSVIAEGLLSGEELSTKHLSIGKDMLWIDPKQRNLVDEKVFGICNPARMLLLRTRKDIEDVRNTIANALNGPDIATQAAQLQKIVVLFEKENEKEPSDEKQEIIEQCTKLRITALEKMTSLLSERK